MSFFLLTRGVGMGGGTASSGPYRPGSKSDWLTPDWAGPLEGKYGLRAPTSKADWADGPTAVSDGLRDPTEKADWLDPPWVT
jgi:hypothetical protein